MEINVKHFVLVHGFGHGAWSWYKIVTLLKSAGHRVTALDLAASGASPSKFDEIGSFSDYIQPLMDFMASLPEDEKVILVGHSYGGFGISLAMETFPNKILVGVYVTAFMPNLIVPPARAALEFFERTQLESLFDFDLSFENGPENPPTAGLFGPRCIAAKLYQNCQPEDLELAKMMLRRGRLFLMDLAKESMLTEEKFGSVDRVFIVCEDDEMLKKDLQEWFIDNCPSTKEVKHIAGADHMPMLSKPKELCHCLLEIAAKYP